jgi:hypothetical protein
MLDCPLRTRGSCPYEQTNLVPTKIRMIGALSLLVSAAVFILVWANVPGFIGILLASIGGFLFLLLGAVILLGTRTQLYATQTGNKWRQDAVLGHAMATTYMTGTQPLPIHIHPLPTLSCPASVTQLFDPAPSMPMSHAVSIYRAALVLLLAHNAIEVVRRHVHITRRLLSSERKHIYVLRLVEIPKPNPAIGDLEQSVLQVVDSWAERDESAEWPEGAPIDKLARAYFNDDVGDPAGTLIDATKEDAISQGLGKNVGRLFKHFEFHQPILSAMEPQRELVDEMSERLRRDQPEFFAFLDREITRGLASRRLPDRD